MIDIPIKEVKKGLTVRISKKAKELLAMESEIQTEKMKRPVSQAEIIEHLIDTHCGKILLSES